MSLIESQIQHHREIIQIHEKHIVRLEALLGGTSMKQTTAPPKPIEPAVANEICTADDAQDAIGLADDAQDMIWNRIRAAHINDTQIEKKTVVGQKENNIQVSDMKKIKMSTAHVEESVEQTAHVEESVEQTAHVEESVEQTAHVEESVEQEAIIVKHPRITKLSQYNKTKQKKILFNMFFEARANIKKLAEIDVSMSDDIDAHIQREADRLLQIYLIS
jgi:hypothetical protein